MTGKAIDDSLECQNSPFHFKGENQGSATVLHLLHGFFYNKLSTGDRLQGGDKEQILQLYSFSLCILCM